MNIRTLFMMVLICLVTAVEIGTQENNVTTADGGKNATYNSKKRTDYLYSLREKYPIKKYQITSSDWRSDGDYIDIPFVPEDDYDDDQVYYFSSYTFFIPPIPEDVPSDVRLKLWNIHQKTINAGKYDYNEAKSDNIQGITFNESDLMSENFTFDGVCHDYVNYFLLILKQDELLVKLYEDGVIYPSSVDKLSDSRITGNGHIWLEYQTEEKTYIIDPTWDDYDGKEYCETSLYQAEFIQAKSKEWFFRDRDNLYGYDALMHGANLNYIDALFQRGQSYYNLDEEYKAISTFNLVLCLKKDHYNAIEYRGWSFYCLKYYKFAIQDLTTVLNVKPDNNKIRFYRGVSYYMVSDYENAISDFSCVIDNNADYSKRALHYRGISYYFRANYCRDYNNEIDLIKNDYFLCIKDGEAMLQIDPNDSNMEYYLIKAKESLDYLNVTYTADEEKE